MTFDWSTIEALLGGAGDSLLQGLSPGESFELHLVGEGPRGELIGVFVRKRTPKHAMEFPQQSRRVRVSSVLYPLRILFDGWNQGLRAAKQRIVITGAYDAQGSRITIVENWFNRTPGLERLRTRPSFGEKLVRITFTLQTV